MECSYCGKEIAEGIPFCPYCGKKQPQALNRDEINKNPYKILQVSEDAEHEVIEAVYKSLARKYHPDSGASSVSEERMQEINWAHGILSDPEKLAEWKMKNGRKQTAKTSAKVQPSPIKKPNPVNKRQSTPVSNPPPKSSAKVQPTPIKKPSSVNERQSPPVSKSPPPSSTGDRSKKPSIHEKPTTTNERKSQTVSNPLPPSTTVVVSKNPSRTESPWPWLLVFGVIVLVLAVVGNIPASYKTSTPFPAIRPTNTYIPTHIPTKVPTRAPTSIFSNCILWSSLKNSEVGNSRCIYGRIVKIYSSGKYVQIIRFSSGAGTLLLWSDHSYFSDVSADMCIAAIGHIFQNASSLYMELSDIKIYKYSGCP